MAVDMTQKPHYPTLGWTLIALVLIIVVYHFAAGRRRRG